MTIENVNIEASIQTAKELIAKEKNLSPALKVALDVLLLLVIRVRGQYVRGVEFVDLGDDGGYR